MRFRLSSVQRSRTVAATLGAALAIPIVGLGLALPAGASPIRPPTAQTFRECPVDGAIAGPNGGVSTCIVGVANQGTITIGGLNTTFHGPGQVDGGFAGNSATVPNWVQALDGVSFSAPPQLLGKPVMVLLGNPNITPPAQSDVFVVAQQAGPMGFSITTPGQSGINPLTVIPLKFHLVNPLLGPNCYIGSNTNPVTVNLTTAMSGTLTGTLGAVGVFAQGNTLQTTGTEVVDGTFATPGATGCGSGGVWDSAIDSTDGLPSPSGANQMILYGNFDLAASAWVEQHLHE